VFVDQQPVSVECLICRRTGSRRVCPACLARVDLELTAIPVLYASLGEMLEPSWGMRSEGRVSGGNGSGSPVPVRMEPLSLRAHGGIVSVLRYWESEWRDALGWSATPFRGSVEQAVGGAVVFLRNNWPWAADEYPQPGEFARSVREWAAACRAQVYGPGDARMIGLCPQTAGDGAVCGTSLWASPYAERIECRGCRASWPRSSWMDLGRRMRMSSEAIPLDSANAPA
jgi:hypothetical protein